MLELENFLPYRLSVLSNTISQAIAREYAERHDLSVTEWRVIAVLGRYAGISASEVADRTAMDKVAVSRAVNRLVDAGRVVRELHEDDRRRSVLRLSTAGRRVYEQIAPRALAYERSLIERLDADERRVLARILDKLGATALEAV